MYNGYVRVVFLADCSKIGCSFLVVSVHEQDVGILSCAMQARFVATVVFPLPPLMPPTVRIMRLPRQHNVIFTSYTMLL